MKLILTEEVSTLGPIGTVVNVKDGYARNYLLPRSLAVVANEANSKELEHHKRVLEKRRQLVLTEMKALAAKIEKLKFSISKQVGEESRIFGSVTTNEVADFLEKEGLKVSKKEIKFSEEIKKLGTYEVEIKLHSEVTAKLPLNVVAHEAA